MRNPNLLFSTLENSNLHEKALTYMRRTLTCLETRAYQRPDVPVESLSHRVVGVWETVIYLRNPNLHEINPDLHEKKP